MCKALTQQGPDEVTRGRGLTKFLETRMSYVSHTFIIHLQGFSSHDKMEMMLNGPISSLVASHNYQSTRASALKRIS